MSGVSILAGLAVEVLKEYPDTIVLIILGAGGYYELHHGRIAEMMTNQHILGTAVYSLYRESEDHDAEAFRDDMWGEDNGGPYPDDWEREPAEPSAGRGGD